MGRCALHSSTGSKSKLLSFPSHNSRQRENTKRYIKPCPRVMIHVSLYVITWGLDSWSACWPTEQAWSPSAQLSFYAEGLHHLGDASVNEAWGNVTEEKIKKWMCPQHEMTDQMLSAQWTFTKVVLKPAIIQICQILLSRIHADTVNSLLWEILWENRKKVGKTVIA